ncbi:formylglycine-generating enzyme family protein [Sorangium cellulosum]|uniref:formylglycine-generating enzyme family protein n=1 Tax=Sorangium cellulosum TaxID=56 RepID=UPI001F223717|nr:SUMF1/EgtB/PvdO family nonheme iron enzyme [Sorangium cellulosum]
MLHRIALTDRPSLYSSALRLTVLNLGVIAVVAGCSPQQRHFPDAGTGGAGTSASSTSSGSGAGGSDGECSDGREECAGNTPRRCLDGSWEIGDECMGQTCVDGRCQGECAPEDVRCSDNQPQRCDERGNWEDAAECPSEAPACDGGKCVLPSCVGLEDRCGPAADENCCAATEVPGGTFDWTPDGTPPASVSGFRLDRFEVTVGRFRRFVEAYPASVDAYPGNRPTANAGRNPKITGSGWQTEWDIELPENAAALRRALKCHAVLPTWTDEPGEHEQKPINCVNWYVAFAFCAWDRGRLPTLAEWTYAAVGGAEQRTYPWSNPSGSNNIDHDHAVFGCGGNEACEFSDIMPVGSKSPLGDGRWMQADLAGNLWEWTLDWHADEYPSECEDCANLTRPRQTDPMVPPRREVRGGAYNEVGRVLLTSFHHHMDPSIGAYAVSLRCAR